ncbi:MAG: hypothetical protein FJX80_15400 [Bacteroidetes bacterium]|nr:hypothetical protein [Bacteroidota bacterium]
MEQRDYLKRQIDQLGQVLGKILLDLLGLKNSGQLNAGIEITNQTLKGELDFEIQDLLEISKDKLIHTLITQKNFTNENLDKLAEILLLVADNQQENTKKLYERCLTIYKYLEKAENIYSLDRQWKIERIKNEL